MRPRRYGSRGSTIATNEDYGKRLMGLLDSLTMFSPIKPAAESLLYAEDYPVAPFATPEDRFDNLMEDPKYQGLLTDAGMAGQGLPVTAPGIVIGAKAKNFPKALAEKFEGIEGEKLKKMNPVIRDNKGPSVFGSNQQANREAFLETGVYRGPDGKLRYEIDDSAAEYFPGETTANYYISDLLNHPELYRNYDDVGTVLLRAEPMDGYAGYHTPETPTQYEKIVLTDNVFSNPKEGKSTLLHEIQHSIQDREGFDLGANKNTAGLYMDSYLKNLDSKISQGKLNKYKHLRQDREVASKADVINYFDRIYRSDNPRPGLVTNTTDFYRYSHELRDRIGPRPKRYGPDMRRWTRNAAQFLRDKNRYLAEEEFIKNYGPRLGKERFDATMDLVGDSNKIRSKKRSIDRQIDKVLPTVRDAKRLQDLEAQLKYTLSPYERYKRVGGEAEARMVQKRMDYTPAERAARFPLDDYDVPLHELIPTSLLD